MGRRKSAAVINVFTGGQLVGQLARAAGGQVTFQYSPVWIASPSQFPVSRSLPVRPAPFSGAGVDAFFDNLLPDNPDVRRLIAGRTGAMGVDAFSLLHEIGRECVGALQLLPDGVPVEDTPSIRAEPLSEAEVERLIADLGRTPLGVSIDPDHPFRISVAGAQQKTALLRYQDRWHRPLGTTPTTHILKPQIGRVRFMSGDVDLSQSVENEYFCLSVLKAFGLPTACAEIVHFGAQKVLTVERFDRVWREGTLIRLPQEDLCQAFGLPSTRKYQSLGGPSAVDVLRLLTESDTVQTDQLVFVKALILFWLMGATDGHAKNFSLMLRPGGGFRLAPLYDVLSVQPAVDAHAIPHGQFKLAMSVGRSGHYRVDKIARRHFLETADEAGFDTRQVVHAIAAIAARAPDALAQATEAMPHGSDALIAHAIANGFRARLAHLQLNAEADS